MHVFPDAASLLRSERPETPVLCLRPQVARDAARRFIERFPGDVFYAVKANPTGGMLDALHAGGVRHFDVASLAEIELVRARFPHAELALMHPVKSRHLIRAAWHQHGVRTFSLDSFDELRKIREELGDVDDLGLVVRLAVPDGESSICLSRKFGIQPAEAADLLLACRRVARHVGIAFHVGSQAMRPQAFEDALDVAGQVICRAGVVVDVIDVGGGFPCTYPDLAPPPLDDYFAAIERGWDRLPVPENCRLWGEPGRVLCAPAASLLVRVELRKGRSLYLNDGTYGSLFDAGTPRFVYPARRVRPGAPERPGAHADFEFYGPTCDGLDHMPGPFSLPADIREGDWIEIGMLGAYSATMRTAFNGFDGVQLATLSDQGPVVAAPTLVPRTASAQLALLEA